MANDLPARRPRSTLTRVDRGILTSIFAALWIVHVINTLLFGGALTAWGVDPRTLSGLLGILFAPLLHVGFLHLLANTVFGYPTALAVMQRTRAEFLLVSVAAGLGSGALVWLFGTANTVGFSGVLFGYLGYLLVLARLGRRVGVVAPGPTNGSLLFALVFSMLPGISLLGHLGGFFSGAAVALVLLSLARSRSR
jgi:membrane associated rhomboid family serine protease